MEDPDYLMALEMQKQFDLEDDEDSDVELKNFEYNKNALADFKKKKWAGNLKQDLDSTCNLVHPEWETLDPTPDVFAMFLAFDEKFFHGKLKCVTLEWSKRMYSCAGICYSRRNRLGMAITIRLSEPLLKLRTRKDLIETLLHEMIHAYLSVLGIKEGNGGHGTNFKKIMQTINKVAGTNITVYHTFRDEVDIYKTHWWRCNGICQHRKPFFGFVKRTSNRAPGPNDIWWRQHLESCGGYFLKVREPEKKIKSVKENTKNKKSTQDRGDIRKFFPNNNKSGQKDCPAGAVKTNGGGTIVINSKVNSSKDNSSNTSVKTGIKQKTTGNLANVVGLKDLNSTSTPVAQKASASMDGVGHCLGANNTSVIFIEDTGEKPNESEREKVRQAWARKFTSSQSSESEQASKRPKLANEPEQEQAKEHELKDESEHEPTEGPNQESDSEPSAAEPTFQGKNKWITIDDEVMLKEQEVSTYDISSDDDDDDNDNDVKDTRLITKSIKKETPEQRQQLIKQEIIDSEENSDDEIEIIDDDYDDNFISSVSELTDTSLIDDIFGDDTLLKDFKRENGLYSRNSKYLLDSQNDIINCPVCQEKIVREVFSDHLDGCTGIQKRIQVFPSTSKAKKPTQNNKKQSSTNSALLKEIVPNAMRGSSSSTPQVSTLSPDGTDNECVDRRKGLLDTSQHACPVCAQFVDVDKINEHLDVCLKSSTD